MNKLRLPRIPSSSLALFAKRLAFLAGIILVFRLVQLYIPQNLTYEYANEEKNAVPASEIYFHEETASALRTLRLDGNKLVIYDSSGTAEYSVYIDGEKLTDYDRALLSEGICASSSELSELIGELLS